MKTLRSRRCILFTLLALLLLTTVVAAVKVTVIPEKTAAKSGEVIYKNSKAAVDASNLDQGYLSVKYTGKKDVRIKVRITKDKSKTNYTYDLNNDGEEETFPLTEGDGTYKVTVFENTKGTKYATAYSCSVKLKLENEFAPFLYPNQYVNFNDDSQVVTTAAQVIKDAKAETDLEKVAAVYHYVVENISYDYALARNVKSGYLPDVDKVLEKGKGICFDYAAVMSAMLRSQEIPCKLVVGYAGSVYHAWINVYIEDTGWVDQLIYFDGAEWSLMDPTFISSSNGSDSVREYVSDGTNYSQKYAY